MLHLISENRFWYHASITHVTVLLIIKCNKWFIKTKTKFPSNIESIFNSFKQISKCQVGRDDISCFISKLFNEFFKLIKSRTMSICNLLEILLKVRTGHLKKLFEVNVFIVSIFIIIKLFIFDTCNKMIHNLSVSILFKEQHFCFLIRNFRHIIIMFILEPIHVVNHILYIIQFYHVGIFFLSINIFHNNPEHNSIIFYVYMFFS